MKCPSIIDFEGGDRNNNFYSFLCQLNYAHNGPHQQTGIVENGESKIYYTIQWSDPRETSKLVIPEFKVSKKILVPV